MSRQVNGTSKRQYRNKIEITANILELTKQGSRKTRIMYLGNLSFDLAQKYLKQLEQLGLVEVKSTEKRERIYNITARGVEFLSDFYELQKHSEIASNKKQILEGTLRAEQ
jgi:predicted transcriptional regulator